MEYIGIQMQLVVDWSQKRQRHVLERMMLRGISRREFHEALVKSRKRRQKHGVLEARYRYYSIHYQQTTDPRGRYKKIYPITVKVVR